MPRPISRIARDILVDWTPARVYFGAAPYLDAMLYLDTLDDMFGADDARGIILYFLSNARNYRGETAKRLKAELRAMLEHRP